MSKNKARFFSNLREGDIFIDENNARLLTVELLAPGSKTAICIVSEFGSTERQLFTYDELYNFKIVMEV